MNVLHYAYLMLSTRLADRRDDERGLSTLEIVLWVGGLAAIALVAIAFIATRTDDALNQIPTGPAGP